MRYCQSAVDAMGDKRVVRTERLPPEEFCFDAAQVGYALPCAIGNCCGRHLAKIEGEQSGVMGVELVRYGQRKEVKFLNLVCAGSTLKQELVRARNGGRPFRKLTLVFLEPLC